VSTYAETRGCRGGFYR